MPSTQNDAPGGGSRRPQMTVAAGAAVALLLAACAAPAPRGDAAGQAPPLPLAECLDPDRARSFVLLENDQLLVDAGRYRYHILLAHACPELGTTHALEFRPAGGIGRLCGGAMETVLPLGARPPVRPCPIRSLRRVSDAEYQALLGGDSIEGTVRGGPGD